MPRHIPERKWEGFHATARLPLPVGQKAIRHCGPALDSASTLLQNSASFEIPQLPFYCSSLNANSFPDEVKPFSDSLVKERASSRSPDARQSIMRERGRGGEGEHRIAITSHHRSVRSEHAC